MSFEEDSSRRPQCTYALQAGVNSHAKSVAFKRAASYALCATAEFKILDAPWDSVRTERRGSPPAAERMRIGRASVDASIIGIGRGTHTG